MNYTEQEVMEYVRQEDVRFIRLAFCDVFGKQKNISILPDELERAFRHGIAIDASAIPGFGGEVRSDLFLHPDPSTLSSLPWRGENGKVVRMFCGVTHPDGTVLAPDSRALLKKAIERAAAAGVSFAFGAEMEFYLFKTDEEGEPTKIPYDRASYMDIAPMDKGENIRREICITLEQMGIQPECSHHEEGPGQNEIDFRYSDPLSAADNAVTFRSVVETIVARNGLAADFSPKPLPELPGNGMHINLSVKSADGRDLLPYVMAFRRGWQGMVMVGHAHTDMDTHPATLSSVVIHDLLRRELGWQGVVISDDMQMRAITDHYTLEQAIALAVNAGTDILLFGNNLSWQPDTAQKVYDTFYRLVLNGTISKERLAASWKRIQALFSLL